ncbi:MAG: hypothetical protein RL092_1942 [Bacteroidota bacterium]|jgi:hypothetical protein
MKKLFIFLLTSFSFFHSSQAEGKVDHKFYVSNTFIEYNAQSSMLEIRIQFFIDDFERILKKETGNKKFELQEMSNGFEREENYAIFKYIENNLKLSVDEIQKNLFFLGYQKDNAETITLYLEVPVSPPFVSRIQIENTFFLTEFHDQKNGVEMKWYGSIQQEYLNQDRTTCDFIRP